MPADAAPPTPAPTGTGHEFSRSRADDLQRLARQLFDSDGPDTLVVLGETGIGKSHALATLTGYAQADGIRLVEVGDGADAEELLAEIERDPTAHRDGSLIVIDDADTFSEPVERLLKLAAETDGAVRIVLSAGMVEDIPDGVALLRSQRTAYLELEPINRTELADLVGKQFRESSALNRNNLTTELLERSDGNPAIIDALLPLVDRRYMTLTEATEPPPTAGSEEMAIVDARAELVTGAYRRAVQKLSALNQVEGLELSTVTRGLLATSLYRIGAVDEAGRLAADLVEESLAADDHESAFRAATIGLPQAEEVDGSPARVEALLAIDPEQLSPRLRFRHAATTARQAMLTARQEVAWQFATRARDMATTVQEKAAVAHLNWWVTMNDTQPDVHIDIIEPLLDEPDLPPGWRALLQELYAISHYEAGNLAQADALVTTIGDWAEEVGNDILAWHHLSFCNMLAFDQGDWAEANVHRVDGMVHARERAIATGEHLFLAQTYHEAWVKGEQANLVSMFDQVPPEIGSSRFGRVALIECLRAAGRLDEAKEIGEPLIAEVLENGGSYLTSILAYLARYIGEVGDRTTADRAYSVLSLRAGTIIVYGAGVVSYGPADRYLFHLTGNPAHLDRAIEVADRANLRLWQVLLRAERSTIPGTSTTLLTKQAERFAEGTELTSLLAT